MKYKIVYVVVHGDELKFASTSRIAANNYKEHFFNSAADEVLNDWGIDDADENDQMEAAYQAGFDEDHIECYRVDLSKFSEDEPVILDDDTELDYNDIITTLGKSKYDELTDF